MTLLSYAGCICALEIIYGKKVDRSRPCCVILAKRVGDLSRRKMLSRYLLIGVVNILYIFSNIIVDSLRINVISVNQCFFLHTGSMCIEGANDCRSNFNIKTVGF